MAPAEGHFCHPRRDKDVSTWVSGVFGLAWQGLQEGGSGLEALVSKQQQQEHDLLFRISGSSCAERQLRRRTLPGPPPGRAVKEQTAGGAPIYLSLFPVLPPQPSPAVHPTSYMA